MYIIMYLPAFPFPSAYYNIPRVTEEMKALALDDNNNIAILLSCQLFSHGLCTALMKLNQLFKEKFNAVVSKDKNFANKK